MTRILPARQVNLVNRIVLLVACDKKKKKKKKRGKKKRGESEKSLTPPPPPGTWEDPMKRLFTGYMLHDVTIEKDFWMFFFPVIKNTSLAIENCYSLFSIIGHQLFY